jgi:hypothetical protein
VGSTLLDRAMTMRRAIPLSLGVLCITACVATAPVAPEIIMTVHEVRPSETVPMTSSPTYPDATRRLKGGSRAVSLCLTKALNDGSLPGGLTHETQESLTTGWRLRHGRARGLWIWRKRWIERVRATIIVSPVTADAGTVVAIFAEIEERPNENYYWRPVDGGREEGGAVAGAIATNIQRLCGGS